MSTGPDARATGPAPRRIGDPWLWEGLRELALAALALALLLCLFFSTPLARWGEGYYSTADLGTSFRLTDVDPRHVPANRLLSDPPFQMQPWMMLARDELAAGRLPSWNPYNACGEPLIANYQSAVFSPFSLPFYCLDFRAALLVSAFLKLFALGLFTWLYLRELSLAFAPALIGATAFMFSGHNVFCLAYPHPGALVALPAGMFFCERALGAFRRGWNGERSTARLHAPLAGFALCLAAGALAGHPEPLFFALAVVGVYALFRLVSAWRALGRAARPALLRLAGKLALAALLGLGLAAVQILPFLEYLGHASAWQARVHNQEPFLLRQWPLWLFPGLLGDPSSPYLLGVRIPPPNFEGANMAYPGGVVLLLALLVLPAARRQPLACFHVVLALAWLLYTHDTFKLAALGAKLPLFDKVPINRSQPVWLWALACLAALHLDSLWGRSGPPSRARICAAIGVLAGAAVFLVAALIAADGLLASRAQEFRPEVHFKPFLEEHMAAMCASYGLGAVALAALWLWPARVVRWSAAVALLAAITWQCAWSFKDYNPTTPERFFFPRTAALQELSHVAGERTIAALGDTVLPAESNSAYRLCLLSSYDAMSVAHVDYAFYALFDPVGPTKDPHCARSAGLVSFGAEYVLVRGAWPRVDCELADAVLRQANRWSAEPLPAGRELVQSFEATRDGLQAVMLYVSSYGGAGDPSLDVRLEEEAGGRVVVQSSLSLRDLLRTQQDPGEAPGQFESVGPPGRQVPLAFPAEVHSRGTRYRLRLASPDGAPRACPIVWRGEKVQCPGGKLESDGKLLSGALYFDYSYAFNDFEELAEMRNYRLYRYKPSPGRYYSVGAARAFTEQPAALRWLRDERFDPLHEVMLHDAGEGLPGLDAPAVDGLSPARPARVIEELPASVLLEVERDTPGWLVLCRASYPGWKAYVDDKEVPVLRANLGFAAVKIPAGKHEVRYRYEPLSLRLGAWIALACAAIGSAIGLRAWLASRIRV